MSLPSTQPDSTPTCPGSTYQRTSITDGESNMPPPSERPNPYRTTERPHWEWPYPGLIRLNSDVVRDDPTCEEVVFYHLDQTSQCPVPEQYKFWKWILIGEPACGFDMTSSRDRSLQSLWSNKKGGIPAYSDNFCSNLDGREIPQKMIDDIVFDFDSFLRDEEIVIRDNWFPLPQTQTVQPKRQQQSLDSSFERQRTLPSSRTGRDVGTQTPAFDRPLGGLHSPLDDELDQSHSEMAGAVKEQQEPRQQQSSFRLMTDTSSPPVAVSGYRTKIGVLLANRRGGQPHSTPADSGRSPAQSGTPQYYQQKLRRQERTRKEILQREREKCDRMLSDWKLQEDTGVNHWEKAFDEVLGSLTLEQQPSENDFGEE